MAKLIRTKYPDLILPPGVRIRGHIYKDTGRFGLFSFGDYEFGKINAVGRDLDGIYQMRHYNEGFFPSKIRFPRVSPNFPTVNRLAARGKFRDANAAWLPLTDQEKEFYNNKAKSIRLTGRMLFVKNYMLSH